MLLASILIVAATVVVVFSNAAAEGSLPFGFEQMIHARLPWLVLGALALGCGLGLAALVRRRSASRYAVFGAELAMSGLLGWSFVVFSFLPPHSLAVGVGDPFPDYALSDHEGTLRSGDAIGAQGATLYIFYRGDW